MSNLNVVLITVFLPITLTFESILLMPQKTFHSMKKATSVQHINNKIFRHIFFETAGGSLRMYIGRMYIELGVKFKVIISRKQCLSDFQRSILGGNGSVIKF